jgi:micrococcal nuclease
MKFIVPLLLAIACIGCEQTTAQPVVSQEVRGGHLLFGKVIAITDGDTLTIKDATGEEHRIRLGEIDAPEKSQEYGKEAAETLKELTLDKDVKVFWKKKDSFTWKTTDHQTKTGRIIGGVYIGDRVINRELLECGAAWHYKEFSKDETFALAESYAKEHKYGLWANPEAIAPWEYRKRKK